MPEELNLTAANAAALADITAANDTPSAPAVEEVQPAAPAEAATPAAEETPPAEEAADATPAAASPTDTAPVQEWTFTRKGQEVKITDPQQAADLIRQGYDYTQKTMELAEQRRQVEANVRNL